MERIQQALYNIKELKQEIEKINATEQKLKNKVNEVKIKKNKLLRRYGFERNLINNFLEI